MDELHVKRNKSVARIAHEQNHARSGEFARWDKIFSANTLPKGCFHSLFGEIVRKNHPRNVRRMISVGTKRERMAGPFAEICAEKSADPGAPAFRDRNDHHISTR